MSLKKQPKHVIRWEQLNKLQRLNYIWVNILSFDMMIKPFFFFWPCWVFTVTHELSLVGASGLSCSKARRFSVSQRRIEPTSPALEGN